MTHCALQQQQHLLSTETNKRGWVTRTLTSCSSHRGSGTTTPVNQSTSGRYNQYTPVHQYWGHVARSPSSPHHLFGECPSLRTTSNCWNTEPWQAGTRLLTGCRMTAERNKWAALNDVTEAATYRRDHKAPHKPPLLVLTSPVRPGLKEVMLYTQVLKAGGECGVRASQLT